MRWLLTILAIASLQLTGLSQTNRWVPRSMSMDDCIETALRHNLDVQIRRYDPEIAGFTLAALYGLYDPSFNLNYTHSDNNQPAGIDAQGRVFAGNENKGDSFSSGFSGSAPIGLTYNLGIALNDQTTLNGITGISTEIYGGDAGFLQLRQPLLRDFWIDSARLQIIIDKREVKRSELDLKFTVMNTVFSVEQAYYNLIFAQENIKVQQKAVELAERQLAENKKRVEVGAMAPLDEKQAASQVATSQADLLNALGTEETQQRTLKGLLSDNYKEWENVAIQPTEKLVALPRRFDLQESWRIGLNQRPDLIQQRITVEEQGYRIRYQRNQLFPRLDAVGSAGYNSASPTFGGYLDQLGGRDNPFYSVGAQLSVPLSNKAAREAYKSSKATRAQVGLTLKQKEQNAMIAIENDIASANTKFQQVHATHEATVYAEAALEAEQKKLENGKSTSFIVLQLTKDLTTARSAEISALANYNVALAQLSLDEGSTLDRRHVKLEWR